MPSDKMIFVADIPESLISFLGLQQKQIKIFRSKGLLAHLLKRKHYKAAKYLDFIPEIISSPDYAGFCDGQIELVKIFKDNIFLSIKLDETKDLYYCRDREFLSSFFNLPDLQYASIFDSLTSKSVAT